jgi:hypothetical protein
MPGWVFTQAPQSSSCSCSSSSLKLHVDPQDPSVERVKDRPAQTRGTPLDRGRARARLSRVSFIPRFFFAFFVPFCGYLSSVNPQNHKALAYGTFRFALGVVELMHGLVRLPMLAGFAAGMAKQFEGTILPGWFVYSFGCVLPFSKD